MRIQYDDRQEIQQPLFLAIENIWAYINQPRLNPQVHISENAYIFDIKLFNKETIREAVLNAILKACAANNDGVITRKSYMKYLPEWVSVDKVRYTLMKLETLKALKREGIGKGTKYYVVSIPENVEL